MNDETRDDGVTDDDIEQAQIEAGSAGDQKMVRLCRVALYGTDADPALVGRPPTDAMRSARAEVERTIREMRASLDEP